MASSPLNYEYQDFMDTTHPPDKFSEAGCFSIFESQFGRADGFRKKLA
jgi:hypothetical protein